jgi:hypothetical protein
MDDGIRLGLSEEPLEEKRRGFGTGLAVILAVFAFLSWRRHGHAAPWYAAGSLASILLARLRPLWLAPVYEPWMKAAGVLGAINTFLFTAAIYYLAFTPYAAILRLFGRDPLERRSARAESYWVPREPLTDAKTYERQY